MRDAEKQEIAEAAEKVDRKQLRPNNKLLREKTKADNKEKAAWRREETAQKSAQEDRKKEAQKVRKARLKALKDAGKVSKSPKQVRSEASKKLQSKVTKRGGDAARRRPQVVHKPSSAPEGVRTRSGRVTRPTKKLS